MRPPWPRASEATRRAVRQAGAAAVAAGPRGLCQAVRETSAGNARAREATGQAARRVRTAWRPLMLLSIGGWRRHRAVRAAAVSARAPPPAAAPTARQRPRGCSTVDLEHACEVPEGWRG